MSGGFHLLERLGEQAACWNAGPMILWIVLQRILLDFQQHVVDYLTGPESQPWILEALRRP